MPQFWLSLAASFLFGIVFFAIAYGEGGRIGGLQTLLASWWWLTYAPMLLPHDRSAAATPGEIIGSTVVVVTSRRGQQY